MPNTFQHPNRTPARPDGWEIAIVCLIILSGLSLRFAFPERLAIEHFDEGVYASNVWFGDTKGKCYPEQQLYAPPLLPALIEYIFVVSGPSNFWAILPGLIAGGLTPLVLWWLGRNWFGPTTGCVAALFCALSEAHILLSRSALTDVPFGLCWLISLLALREACTSGRLMSVVLAGGYVGLAWWTKYNGWMPLAIAIGAILFREVFLQWIRDPQRWVLTTLSIKGWLISSITAILIWAPWVWILQKTGGYAAVAMNHRRYVVGPVGWWSSFTRQFEQLSGLGGPLTGLSFLASAMFVIWIAIRKGRRLEVLSEAPADSNLVDGPLSVPPHIDVASHSGLIKSCDMLPVILVILGTVWPAIGLAGLALVGLARGISRLQKETKVGEHSPNADLSFWILVVWWGGLFLATPLYHPYLRLTVPWLLASFLAAGLCLQQIIETLKSSSNWFSDQPSASAVTGRLWSNKTRTCAIVGTVALATWLGSSGWAAVRGGIMPACFLDRSGLRTAAEEIKRIIEPAGSSSLQSRPAAVYVFAEPGLLFQLRLAGVDLVGPAGSLKFAESQKSTTPNRAYLAIGIHAKQDLEFQKQFIQVQSRLKRVGQWSWHLSPLVSLDQPNTHPTQVGRDPAELAEVELFEVLAE